MGIARSLTLLLSLLTAACAATDLQTKPTIQDLEPRPILVANDPINRLAETQVDALVLTVTIDGPAVYLDSVTLTRVRRAVTQRGTGEGDRVKAVGYARGSRVSEGSAPDAVLNVQEEVGVVRLTKRQVVVTLPAPRALDTVEISAPATNATARLDVRAAYAPYCRDYKDGNKYCPNPDRSN